MSQITLINEAETDDTSQQIETENKHNLSITLSFIEIK